MRPLNIVADGDSWNDYPHILGTSGGLADHLGKLLGVPILNIAHAGDSTEETVGLAKSERLEKVLPNADFLLWSSGGDDFAGDWFHVALNPNTDGDISKAVNWTRFNAMLDLVVADYEELLELIASAAPNCVLVSHTYDYPPARVMGKGVLFLGPWLQPGFIRKGWTNVDDQVAVTKTLLMQFRSKLQLLNSKYLDRWLLVDTQGTCDPVDWQNELHLEDSGWTKVAQRINAAMMPWLDKLSPSSADREKPPGDASGTPPAAGQTAGG